MSDQIIREVSVDGRHLLTVSMNRNCDEEEIAHAIQGLRWFAMRLDENELDRDWEVVIEESDATVGISDPTGPSNVE